MDNNILSISFIQYFFLQRGLNLGSLSREETNQLVVRWQTHQDPDARNRLIASHMGLLRHKVIQHRGYGFSDNDLFQQGVIGFLKSLEKYDPTAGPKLVYYATAWVNSEIKQYIQDNFHSIKVNKTKPQKKVFYKLKSVMRQLGIETNALSDPQVEAIAAELEVPPKDIKTMADYMFNPILYFSDTNDIGLAQDPILASLENQNITNMIQTATHILSDRERDIVESRFEINEKEKQTLDYFAKKYNVSRERIRQIEAAALKKMRTFIIKKLKTTSLNNEHKNQNTIIIQQQYRFDS